MFSSYLRIISLACLASALSAAPDWAVTPASVSTRMARHLFAGSGSPVILRRVDSLTDCQATSAGDGVWVVAAQDVVTEFVYDARAICVSVFVRKGQEGQSGVRFDLTQYGMKYGTAPDGEFSVRQRVALAFPGDPPIPPDESILEIFFRKVARPVNLQHAGSLASAMRDVDSPEAGSEFAGEVLGKSPRSPAGQAELRDDPKPDPGHPTAAFMPAAMLWLSITLSGAAFFLFFRSRYRAHRIAAKQEPVEEEPPPVDPLVEQAPVHEGIGRKMLSLPVSSEKDKKVVNEIDALILDLTRKAGFRWKEVEEITKQAKKVSEMAAMEDLPVLEIVREFLKDQIKNAHLKRGAVIGPPGRR